MPKALAELVRTFKDRRILVIGDVMLDHYVWGEVERISPEAPVPVLHVEREDEVPGGAANVAVNVAALGGKALLLGVRGADAQGERLASVCAGRGVRTDLVEGGRPTTTKTRFVAQNQQLLRADREDASPLDPDTEKALLDALRTHHAEAELILLSDYNKGVVTENICDLLREAEAPVVVDPKPPRQALYRGFHLMSPNHNEAARIAGTPPKEHPPAAAAARIAAELTENVLVTCGPRGMYLHGADGTREMLDVRARQVYDVSGAGDTVLAVIGLALAAGAALHDAAVLANHAAGIVVGKIGMQPVAPNELIADILGED